MRTPAVVIMTASSHLHIGLPNYDLLILHIWTPTSIYPDTTNSTHFTVCPFPPPWVIEQDQKTVPDGLGLYAKPNEGSGEPPNSRTLQLKELFLRDFFYNGAWRIDWLP